MSSLFSTWWNAGAGGGEKDKEEEGGKEVEKEGEDKEESDGAVSWTGGIGMGGRWRDNIYS